MSAAEMMRQLADSVDHLLLGVSDLDRGIQWIEEKSGIRAMIGGVHPGMGTRNALVSLGGKRYLEIIAPDPAQKTGSFFVDLRTLAEPKLITWAASSSNLDAVAKAAEQLKLEKAGPFDGSRTKPDGSVLRWKILFIQAGFAVPPVDPFPFFIQWSSESTHPSSDSPKGCELVSLSLESPKAEELNTTLQKVWIAADVKKSDSARIIATINTPKGKLLLN